MQQDPFTPQYGVQVPQQNPVQQYGGMPVGQPKKRLNGLLIPLIITVLLLMGSIGFGIWAFMGMQDYKNNVEPKINAAVEIAKQETSTAKDAEFVEKEKLPTKQYQSPQAAGTVTFSYPKTWAAFVTEKDSGNTPVDGYFHPDFVPGVDSGTDFALRLQVLEQSYDQELRKLEGKIKQGKLTVSPYSPPMLKTEIGVIIEGEINTGQQNTMIMFPLRDKTIQISTESSQFKGDFINIIMANFTFTP